jgi:hypothetical protein
MEFPVPLFLGWRGNSKSFISKTMIDFLKGPNIESTTDDDPRLMILSGGIGTWASENAWNPIVTDPLGQKGLPNGYDINQLKNLEGNQKLNPIQLIHG